MILPLHNAENPYTFMNQLLEADVVYVRDFTFPDRMSSEQLKHLAMIAHHCYGSYDLTANCIHHLASRGALPSDAMGNTWRSSRGPPDVTLHPKGNTMLTLYYAPGACSMAAHIVLEESGEKYEAKRMDLSKGEQRTEAYLKIHPLGRVPALGLDNGEPLTENTAILPYLGKRYRLWPKDPVAEAARCR